MPDIYNYSCAHNHNVHLRASTGEVLYTPPEGESIIRDKLKNLEDYIHKEDSTDPLVKLAVINYQFEAIHPFFDGNGRTGRENLRWFSSLITLPMGDKKMPGIASEDIGKCAYGIFKNGAKYIGKTVGIAGEHLTVAEMAAELGKALGQEVRYNAVTPEEYRGFGFPVSLVDT